jgi:hypothetical protein
MISKPQLEQSEKGIDIRAAQRLLAVMLEPDIVAGPKCPHDELCGLMEEYLMHRVIVTKNSCDDDRGRTEYWTDANMPHFCRFTVDVTHAESVPYREQLWLTNHDSNYEEAWERDVVVEMLGKPTQYPDGRLIATYEVREV